MCKTLGEWISQFNQIPVSSHYKQLAELFAQLKYVNASMQWERKPTVEDEPSALRILYYTIVLQPSEERLSFLNWNFSFLKKVYKECNTLSLIFHPDKHSFTTLSVKKDNIDSKDIKDIKIHDDLHRFHQWTACITFVKQSLTFCMDEFKRLAPCISASQPVIKKEEKEEKVATPCKRLVGSKVE